MPKYIPFKVDNKAPKLVIIKPLNGSHHSGNVDLKAIAEDDKELSVIGVTNIELRRNFIEKRISNTQKELIGGFDSRVAPYPEYGINFVAKDSAGNESTKQIIIIIENTTTIEERGN